MPDEQRPSRRTRQAEQTRRDIVAAARPLFAQQGYAATSMAQIARGAGVSVQTIYDSVGSKSAIVRQLNDLLDDEGDVGPLASRIPTTTDPVELLGIAVAISRNINERCEDLVAAIYSAASVEPEMAAVRDESRRRHRAGIGGLSKRLASLGSLRSDIDVETAADVIAGLTDPQVARTFVSEYGWSWERWHGWTVEALGTLVLRSASGRSLDTTTPPQTGTPADTASDFSSSTRLDIPPGQTPQRSGVRQTGGSPP